MFSQTSYRDALTYIYSFTDYEKRGFAVYAPEFYNLEREERLLALLGDPRRRFRSVHIAGTKGKGSTSAMIEAILRAAGYRTGLYTSPHLHTFRERIQANGRLIPEQDVVRLVDRLRPLVRQVPGITTFEIMTGLALAWYAEQGVEFAVLEVGLGGRLDATNVVTPEVSVLTSISYDHMLILGQTLTKIATEKAGIIKAGIPVVSAPQTDEALAVIDSTCQRLGSPLCLVGRDWTWTLASADLEGQSFSLGHGQDSIEGLWVPLLGEYQVVNAATAVATAALLRDAGVEIPEESIRNGLGTVRWPARLEILGRSPLVVADSAHNGDSAEKLMAALKKYLDYRRLLLVLGASPDHATPHMMESLLSGADHIIVTRSSHARAAEPTLLQARAERLGYEVDVSATVAQALEQAMAMAQAEDLVCCAGSVFVAAEAREAWFARQGMPSPPTDPA